MSLLRRDARAEMLRRVPLLHRCSRRDLREIASVAEERDLEPGHVIAHEGDPGREFFILIAGQVEVRQRGRRIREIGPGGFFGEIALLTAHPRTATVTTTAPTRVLVLRSAQFTALLRRNAPMAVKIMQALAERIPVTTT